MSWTEERVETMLKLREDGLTCSQVAKRLDVSRSAIIGKLHRLGISHDQMPKHNGGGMAKPTSRDARARKRVLTPKISQVRRPSAVVREELPTQQLPPAFAEEASRGVALLDLTPKSCRWPLGDPRDESFRFCGADRVIGKPYCLNHCCAAYQGVSQFKPTRPSRHNRMRRAA